MEVLISGGVVLVLLAIAFRQTHKRVDIMTKELTKKRDTKTCDIIEGHIQEKFDRGNKKFSQLEVKTDILLRIQNEHSVLLGRIDERIGRLTQSKK